MENNCKNIWGVNYFRIGTSIYLPGTDKFDQALEVLIPFKDQVSVPFILGPEEERANS